MTILQQRQYDRLNRSLKFLGARENDIKSSGPARALYNDLRELVSQIEESRKKPRGRTYSSPKIAALNNLRADIVKVSRTAAVISQYNPDFKNSFSIPDKRRKDDLVKTARDFVEKVGENKKVFGEWEIKDAFLKTMQRHIEEYQKVASAKPGPVGTNRRASDEVSALLEQGAVLMESLDVLMENKFHEQSEELSAWREAAALEKSRRRSRKRKDAQNDA